MSASAPAARRGRRRGRGAAPGTRRGRERAGLVAALAVAVAAWALVPTYPNYDAYYHLVWGRELLDGAVPTFQAYAAPTQHPLFLALCAALGLVAGGDADRVLVLVCALSLVALAFATYRTGDALFGPGPGLLGAAFVASSFAFLLYAARAYVDVPFLALVMWAAALEARAPRRGRAVMALLLAAGLLRPEAWVLAGAYWLWCGPRRLDLLALAAAAPLLWAAVDLRATGDPLFSLHATSDLADELNRDRGAAELPAAFATFLVDTARAPVALAAVVGGVAAVALRPAPGRLHVLVGLFAAGTLTFVATGLAGLSVLPRYLTVPAVVACLLAGYGVLGFATLAPGRARTLWRRAAIVLAVAGVAFVAVRAPVVERLGAELRFIRTSHEDLVALLDEPAVRRDLRCGPLTFPTYRLVPDARWILDLPAERVGARSARRRSRGVAVFVLGEKGLRRFGFAAGTSPTVNIPDPGFAPIARNESYAAYSSCP